MPCPFGFTADDADNEDMSSDEEEEEEEGKEDDEAKAGEGIAEGSGNDQPDADQPKIVKSGKPVKSGLKAEAPSAEPAKKKKKKVTIEHMNFDFDKDPVSWFYQNQIKSEAEFAKKKDMLRAEARKRLDAIMSKKDKRVEWPSDSDLDELSIRSSELSDLDSDVDSLGSILSCADSWIEDARYGTPAEKTLTYVSYSALATSGFSLYLTVQAVNTTRKVVGVLTNTVWPNAAFLSGALLGASFIGALLAVRYRSRRLLLISQGAMMALYSAFLVILCGVVFQPTTVDAKLRDVACVKYGKSDQGSRLCKMLPGIERDLADQMYSLCWAGGLAAATALACLICSVWYLYELSYIEKKAIKHKRRHKRRKHSIPWEKLKIVGPVSRCGGGGGGGGAAGGGKCPVMHSSGGAAAAGAGAAQASKCPMGFAAKATGEKKND